MLVEEGMAGIEGRLHEMMMNMIIEIFSSTTISHCVGCVKLEAISHCETNDNAIQRTFIWK